MIAVHTVLAIEIFLLGLSPGALAVYSYLLCCENRQTYFDPPVHLPLSVVPNLLDGTHRPYGFATAVPAVSGG